MQIEIKFYERIFKWPRFLIVIKEALLIIGSLFSNKPLQKVMQYIQLHILFKSLISLITVLNMSPLNMLFFLVFSEIFLVLLHMSLK